MIDVSEPIAMRLMIKAAQDVTNLVIIFVKEGSDYQFLNTENNSLLFILEYTQTSNGHALKMRCLGSSLSFDKLYAVAQWYDKLYHPSRIEII